MYEMIDVYDENKNKTGRIIDRKDADTLNKDEYVIVAHCWIINSSKKILVTQRSLNKNRAGKWEDTHGGVRAGETSIQGMKRELKEELGIDINDNELKLVKTIKKENKFRDIYIITKDISIEDISFNDGEVMDCKYVTIDEFREMIEKGECSFKNFKDTIFCDNDIDYFLEVGNNLNNLKE